MPPIVSDNYMFIGNWEVFYTLYESMPTGRFHSPLAPPDFT